MAKSVLKILILNIFLISCSINPTYTRKDIERVIEKMCKNEFDIDVRAIAIGETIWIYAPFDNLIKDDKSLNKKTEEKVQHIFLSLKRVILSMDAPPKFFSFVASNIKNTGVDLYQIGFIPDIIKFELQFISQEEFHKRLVFVPMENPQALGDKSGTHVTMNETTMGDFITYLVLQKLIRTYYRENNKYVEINTIDGNYQYGKITIITDIKQEYENKDKIFSPFSVAEEALRYYLKIYEEFTSEIDYIEIIDKTTNKKRFYTKKAFLEKNGS